MSDEWEGSGYDAEAGSGGGLWLRLKRKDEELRMRLCSTPFRYIQTFTDQNTGKPVEKRKAAWIVILKEVDGNGKPVKSVRVFDAGQMIYGLIRDLAGDEDWGDPLSYDIKVKRTEESGKYYKVSPVPNCKPLSSEDKALLSEANIDLEALCTKGGSSGSSSSGGGHDEGEEYDPFANEDE